MCVMNKLDRETKERKPSWFAYGGIGEGRHREKGGLLRRVGGK